jgi:hypothetical protein
MRQNVGCLTGWPVGQLPHIHPKSSYVTRQTAATKRPKAKRFRAKLFDFVFSCEWPVVIPWGLKQNGFALKKSSRLLYLNFAHTKAKPRFSYSFENQLGGSFSFTMQNRGYNFFRVILYEPANRPTGKRANEKDDSS